MPNLVWVNFKLFGCYFWCKVLVGSLNRNSSFGFNRMLEVLYLERIWVQVTWWTQSHLTKKHTSWCLTIEVEHLWWIALEWLKKLKESHSLISTTNNQHTRCIIEYWWVGGTMLLSSCGLLDISLDGLILMGKGKGLWPLHARFAWMTWCHVLYDTIDEGGPTRRQPSQFYAQVHVGIMLVDVSG